MHFKTMLLNTIKAISAFSFFIYLLHPIILDSLFAYTNIFEDNTIVFLAISLFNDSRNLYRRRNDVKRVLYIQICNWKTTVQVTI